MSRTIAILFALCCVPVAYCQQLLINGSFEERVPGHSDQAAGWTEGATDADGLVFASEHHQGATSAMIPGDGKERRWRQRVDAPTARAFTLSGMIKSEGLSLVGKDDYAMLYGHILYKGHPYSDATHFYVKISPGTYDWTRLTVDAATSNNDPIEAVLVSVVGKISGGRVFVDEVELTESRSLAPEVLLSAKIADLRKQLIRVGPVDDSAVLALKKLELAQNAVSSSLGTATEHWESASAAVSAQTWAAIYPDALPQDGRAEARMIYHALAQDKVGCDKYLDVVTRTGCNGVYHSLGSWMGVVHHSSLVPVEPGWKDFDALKYAISEAKKRGIKSFAYIASLYGTSEPPKDYGLYKDHPDWFAHGPDKNMPTFPDPANPEVADFIVKMYTELATKYDLDGIGLDYIRYPSPTALNYDARNRAEILARFGFDISEAEPWRDPVKWEKVRLYRAEKVGAIVHRIRDAIHKVKPKMAVMACLISDPDEAMDYGQRWAVSGQWIDYLSPMNYDKVSGDVHLLEKQKAVANSVKSQWIPAIGGMPSFHQQTTITEWAQMVATQRKLGADGLIIYRMGGFDPAVSSFFGKCAFRGSVQFPPPLK